MATFAAAGSPSSRPSSAVSSQQRRDDALGAPAVPGNHTVRDPSSSGNSISSSSINQDAAFGTMGGDWRNVRTLPTWVQSRDDDDRDSIALPPIAAKRPDGRLHDQQRESTPITPVHPSVHGNKWKRYVENTAYPPTTAHSEKRDTNWLAEQGDLSAPWLASGPAENGAAEGPEDHEALWSNTKKKRRIWYKRIHVMLLNSPMVPLTFRSIIFLFSVLALSLAGSIFHLSKKYGFPQKPSTIMAIVVDVFALVYLIYITWDEYSGKPLGLRSPKAKIRLLMFDLFFIVFDSANLSLAFDTLYDVRWSCRSPDGVDGRQYDNESTIGTPTDDPICDRQRALSAFVFLALLSWVITFMISVFRVVERVANTSGR